MSSRNKVSTNIESSKTELESTMNTKLDELKTEIKADKKTTFNYLNMKISTLTSKKLLLPMTNILMISCNDHS